MTENAKPVKLILFDLGGVLVELGPSPLPSSWLASRSSNFTLQDWFCSPSATRFEKGLCSPAEFASALKLELGIKATPAQILSAFMDWPRGPMAGAHAMLETLKPHYRLAVLSNSNQQHWPKLTREFGFETFIERFFSSHLLHLSKPDPDIFHCVLRQLDVSPGDILFFDDNRLNVDSAKLLGIRSALVNGPRDIERYIQRHLRHN